MDHARALPIPGGEIAWRRHAREPRPVEGDATADELAVAGETREASQAVPAPGLADIEAAARLVGAGVAPRVRLIGLRPWPGLLSEAQDIAADAGVLIVAVHVEADGRVDLVVSADPGRGG